MNAELSVKSSLTRPPVVVRAVLANNCRKTQISQRLANQLGLHSFRDVYIKDNFSVGHAIKWKVSLQPVIITVTGLRKHKIKAVYPLVNCQERDAYWEMILGQDCQEIHEVLNLSGMTSNEGGQTPTPGPSYDRDLLYMGHNISIIQLSNITNPPDVFFEFPCFDSEALSRLAVNKVTGQMVVVYHDSDTVYQYNQVPSEYFTVIESGASKGATVQAVKDHSEVEVIEQFPDAALTNFEW